MRSHVNDGRSPEVVGDRRRHHRPVGRPSPCRGRLSSRSSSSGRGSRPAPRASSRAACGNSGARRSNCRLARESAAFFADLPARLDSTLPLGLSHAAGTCSSLTASEQLAQLAAAVSVQNAAGVPSTLLSPDEAATVVPGLEADGLTGASWCEEDGYFDRPQSVVEAFAQAAWTRGAELLDRRRGCRRSRRRRMVAHLGDGSTDR